MAIELEITALPWLERLLSITTFFSVCRLHPDVAKHECNKYCLDCNERPLCNACIKTSDHDDHRVIQIRRSSYNDVVKATEIQDHVDINGIQTYVINGSKVVFLNRRYFDQVNLKRKNYKCTCTCRVCQRNLVEASDFCSLACKLQWVKVKGTFVLRARKAAKKGKKPKETTKSSSSASSASSSSSSEKNEKLPKGKLKRKPKEEKEEENGEQEVESVISRAVSFRSPTSRRKGIPHRAPFF